MAFFSLISEKLGFCVLDDDEKKTCKDALPESFMLRRRLRRGYVIVSDELG